MTNETRLVNDPAEIGGWHLDKRVNVSIITAIGLHIAATIWWAATIQTQTNSMLERLARQDALIQAIDGRAQIQQNSIIETATQLRMMSNNMDRQTTLIDRLSDQVGKIPGVREN